MFKQENRLRNDADVKAVVKTGRSVFDPICGVKWKKNNKEIARFAVVAGIKVSKKAVDRNRIKRQYREIIKEVLEDMEKGVDVVLLTSSKALELPYQEKREQLHKVLKKARLL